MDKFNNPAVIWFIIGFACFLLEFVVPGLILFFFAVGAWVVAILSLFMDLSINEQLLIFLGTAILTIVFFRKWVKNIMLSRKESNEIEDELIGKTGKAETFIGPGVNGKIDFRGTSWDACSDDSIQKGEIVKIVGNDSILLIVKSSNFSA